MTVFPSVSIVKQAAAELGMAACLTGYAIRQEPGGMPPGCRMIPIQGEDALCGVQICMISRAGRNLRHPERVAVTCIQDYFQTISPLLPGGPEVSVCGWNI